MCDLAHSREHPIVDFHEAPVDPEREGRFTRTATAERTPAPVGDDR